MSDLEHRTRELGDTVAPADSFLPFQESLSRALGEFKKTCRKIARARDSVHDRFYTTCRTTKVLGMGPLLTFFSCITCESAEKYLNI